jgi:protein-S-isoprenylcysteine O-methyltransferase Ste14
MTAAPDASPRLVRKLLVRTGFYLLFLAVLLFGAAGTNWPAAWVYLALSAIMSVGGGFWLARHDPALLEERLGSLIQREQEPWDKRFMMAMMVLWAAWLVLMGLDAGRYRWSEVPLLLQIGGAVLIFVGTYIVWRTFAANTYAAPVIKIQKERGHRVVTTGPYAYVRHPMYAGALLFILGAPLLLDSWWGLLAALILIILVGTRAVLEERTLAAELVGYADYAKRVRYRLIPRLW